MIERRNPPKEATERLSVDQLVQLEALAARERMSRHRDEMKELGFKHVSTHLPVDDLTFLDREKKIRGLATRGHTMSSLLAELRDLRPVSYTHLTLPTKA